MTHFRKVKRSDRTSSSEPPARERHGAKHVSADDSWDDDDERESVDDLDEGSWMRTRMSSF